MYLKNEIFKKFKNKFITLDFISVLCFELDCFKNLGPFFLPVLCFVFWSVVFFRNKNLIMYQIFGLYNTDLYNTTFFRNVSPVLHRGPYKYIVPIKIIAPVTSVFIIKFKENGNR